MALSPALAEQRLSIFIRDSNTQNMKKLVVFTSDPWDSALAHLRFRAPAEFAGWQVNQGYDGGRVFVNQIAEADVVLIQRDLPRYTEVYRQAVSTAREYHKPLVYEIDDLQDKKVAFVLFNYGFTDVKTKA